MTVDIDALIDELDLVEKCAMVRGRGAWEVPGAEHLGIPDWCLADGPVGVRGRSTGPGLVVPGPSALAATWNPPLINDIGAALGTECKDRKVDVLLGPTVNLHRSPRGGRHFESYSEDPELSSRIAVAYIEGVQSRGVGACVKHFVANDQEFERFTIDVQVDERTLREIYLPPFEAAVTEAKVWSVMGAYNFVNGEHACAHLEMLETILKREWGFQGFVVTDWGAIKETDSPALNGLDLEMPGPGRRWGHGQLEAAVAEGRVPEGLIDDKVRRILRFLDWAGRLGTPSDHTEQSVERPEHRELVRLTAAESMVLVRNVDAALPLTDMGTVSLIGPGVADTALLGGGSATLLPHRTTNVLDAMADRLGARLVGTAPGLDMKRLADPIPPDWITSDGVTFELFDGLDFEGEVFDTIRKDRAFNVWLGDTWPSDHDSMSVRASFEITAPETARYRFSGLGFQDAKLFVDDELVADNQVDGFGAGLGRHAASGSLDLVAGETYRIRLDHQPREGGQWICIVEVRIELERDVREANLREAEQLAAEADTAVVIVGSNSEWESEGADRDSISLPNGQDDLVRRVAAVNPRTVVVLNCGAPMTLPWLDDVSAVLLAWYPGQEGGEAIADVLMGDADPGGRMPTTWAHAERDTPSFLNYPGEAGVVRYGEGVFVGYRHYDARAVVPMIPFGHGGSYTTFEWGVAEVTGDGTDLIVSVPVTNTGGRGGSDVVQIYIAPHDAPVARPPKELAGFAKVSLRAGESAIATITLGDRSFARWDPSTHAWVVDPGEYSIIVAASAADVRASHSVTL